MGTNLSTTTTLYIQREILESGEREREGEKPGMTLFLAGRALLSFFLERRYQIICCMAFARSKEEFRISVHFREEGDLLWIDSERKSGKTYH